MDHSGSVPAAEQSFEGAARSILDATRNVLMNMLLQVLPMAT